jgi:hypothetical protein
MTDVFGILLGSLLQLSAERKELKDTAFSVERKLDLWGSEIGDKCHFSYLYVNNLENS